MKRTASLESRAPARRVLSLDIGNTRISAVYFDRNGSVRWRKFFSTAAADLKPLKRMAAQIDADAEVTLLSVVPAATRRFSYFLKRECGKTPWIMGKDCPFAILNRARKPAQVGMDRLANAAAAWAQSRQNAVVIDFGTAVTFDVVSAEGEYLGGAIAPGVRLSLKSLGQNTALLPKLAFQEAGRVIGRDTRECLLSGCVIGLASLCDGMIARIRREWKRPFLVIATGGDAGLMRRYAKTIQRVDPDLTHKGNLISLKRYLASRPLGCKN